MALSPSMAESFRAVFAAFLWHEGIVHDAMTCASFLKFYPSLPKNGAVVTKRTTERYVLTAHSAQNIEEHVNAYYNILNVICIYDCQNYNF